MGNNINKFKDQVTSCVLNYMLVNSAMDTVNIDMPLSEQQIELLRSFYGTDVDRDQIINSYIQYKLMDDPVMVDKFFAKLVHLLEAGNNAQTSTGYRNKSRHIKIIPKTSPKAVSLTRVTPQNELTLADTVVVPNVSDSESSNFDEVETASYM